MTLLGATSKINSHIQSSKALAFTRNPFDTDVSPATYTAEGASSLFLTEQPTDIAIDGSESKDEVNVEADTETRTLSNYNVRGFEGDDEIDFGLDTTISLVNNSVINGNVGNDTMRIDAFSIAGSYFLGGKGNDSLTANFVSDGEVNGNIGDDTITVTTGTFNGAGTDMYVGGGQGNDVITVAGDYTDSIIDGNKGSDIIEVQTGDHSGSSVNGGEGDDIIRASSANTEGLVLNGDLGNDTILSIGGFGSTVTGGEGSDTIVSAAAAGQASTIDAGVGGDTIVTISGGFGASTETIVFNSGDSVAATKTSFKGAAGIGNSLSGGDKITFGNKVDFLQGVGTNDKIDIDFEATEVVDVTNSNLTKTLDAGTIYEVYGSFDSTTNVFTVATTTVPPTDPAGPESIYIVGGQNLTLGQVFTNSTNMFVTDEDLSLANFA